MNLVSYPARAEGLVNMIITPYPHPWSVKIRQKIIRNKKKKIKLNSNKINDNLGQTLRPSKNQPEKRELAELWKLKENEKKDKYLDLARELHESDTNCN